MPCTHQSGVIGRLVVAAPAARATGFAETRLARRPRRRLRAPSVRHSRKRHAAGGRTGGDRGRRRHSAAGMPQARRPRLGLAPRWQARCDHRVQAARHGKRSRSRCCSACRRPSSTAMPSIRLPPVDVGDDRRSRSPALRPASSWRHRCAASTIGRDIDACRLQIAGRAIAGVVVGEDRRPLRPAPPP